MCPFQTVLAPCQRLCVLALVSAFIATACTVDSSPLTSVESATKLGAASIDETTAAEEPKQTDQTEQPEQPEQPENSDKSASAFENLAPHIVNTSYRCDPVIESVLYSVGDIDKFTLTVNDEFPLSLIYAADSSADDVLNVSVDEDGIFTATALKAGESFLWMSVYDHDGLVDEYELHAVVE